MHLLILLLDNILLRLSGNVISIGQLSSQQHVQIAVIIRDFTCWGFQIIFRYFGSNNVVIRCMKLQHKIVNMYFVCEITEALTS